MRAFGDHLQHRARYQQELELQHDMTAEVRAELVVGQPARSLNIFVCVVSMHAN